MMRMYCVSLFVRACDEDYVHVLWQAAGERQWLWWYACDSLLVRGGDEYAGDDVYVLW